MRVELLFYNPKGLYGICQLADGDDQAEDLVLQEARNNPDLVECALQDEVGVRAGWKVNEGNTGIKMTVRADRYTGSHFPPRTYLWGPIHF